MKRVVSEDLAKRGELPLIAALEQGLDELTFSDYATLLGQLERLKALVWFKMVGWASQAKGYAKNNADMLTMAQAAKRLNVPRSKAYELARRHELPAVKIGKCVRVHPDQLAGYQKKLPRL